MIKSIYILLVLIASIRINDCRKELDNDVVDFQPETPDDKHSLNNEPKDTDNSEKNIMSHAIANFSLQFLKLLKPNENVLFSPMSVVNLLGILFAGAAKNTKKQIGDAVFRSLDDQKINDMIKNFTDSAQNSSNNEQVGIMLKTANKLYCDVQEQIKPKFLNILTDYFRSQIELVNFQLKSEETRKSINSWVSERTNNKITELFKSGSITPDSSLVLINAMYFKGIWTSKFDVKNNTRGQFHTSADKSTNVEMMVQTNSNYMFHSTETAKILGLPYGNRQQYVMFVILPVNKFGLDNVIKELTGRKLLSLIRSASSSGYITTVSLPKFKIQKAYDLSQTFASMNMTDMFLGGVADFSNIDNKKDKYVSNAVHQAVIEVNEEGAEASGASGATVEWRMAPRKISFNVNEPYLFLIFDRETASILFFGRVNSLA